MSATVPPTLDDLRQALDRARTELACAEQITDFDRMKRETARWRENVAMLEKQVADAAKHTQGPWRVGRAGTVVADHPVPGIGGSGDVEYYGGHLVAESVAPQNRPIIAAAPQMFAALKALLPEVDAEIEQRQSSGNNEYWAGLKLLSDRGHAAIAKAEGRA